MVIILQQNNLTVIVVIALVGIVFMLVGLWLGIYPQKGGYLNYQRGMSLESLTKMRVIKHLVDLLAGNVKSFTYRWGHWTINRSEAVISVRVLYLLKMISVLAVAVILLLVRQTNMDVLKTSVIGKSNETLALFGNDCKTDYTYNISFYNTVLKKAGEQSLKAASGAKKAEIVKRVIPEALQTSNTDLIDEKTNEFLNIYNAVQGIKLINWWVMAAFIMAFWLPEAFLLIRRLLKNSSYKKETIKLENIFELLGGINGFKTLNIIEEMEKCSKPYKKHLNRCRELFKTEKELALETLKLSAKNSRLSRLVDVMRVYSTVDRTIALQILERNRLEKDEEVFFTAEEDVDMVDMIAFISIVPILFELANLMMSPMLKMIYDAFKYI